MSVWLQPSWGAGARWYATLVRRAGRQAWTDEDVRALQRRVRRLAAKAEVRP